MNLGELVALARTRLGDENAPYLWSDDFLIGAFNRAESEAAERALLLRDSRSKMTDVAYVAGDPHLTIDPSILYIDRAIRVSDNTVLRARTRNEMDNHDPVWETRTAERPWGYVKEGTRIRLIPTPTQPGNLKLHVFRTPVDPMASLSDEPEIDPIYHEALIHYVVADAYSHSDADSDDPQRANRAASRFDRVFGRRKTARFSQMNRDHPKNSTIYMRRFGQW